MRQSFIVSILFLATSSYGQAVASDTTGKVVPVKKASKALQPAYYVDGTFVSGVMVDPQSIASINVVNGEVQLDNRTYKGQVYIKTKPHEGFRFTSLSAIKDKYTEFKNKPVIFIVDGEIVKGDYDKYVVDESYVLQINIDTVSNSTEKIDLGVIELVTKSDANLKKAKEIRIRGGAVTRSQNQPPTAALRHVG